MQIRLPAPHSPTQLSYTLAVAIYTLHQDGARNGVRLITGSVYRALRWRVRRGLLGLQCSGLDPAPVHPGDNVIVNSIHSSQLVAIHPSAC